MTTCAPGRRAVQALVPLQDVAPLGEEFELVREAVAYLRAGSELGFGSLADPEVWLDTLEVPASVLSASQLLEAASLADTAAAVRATFKGGAAKFPRMAERAAALADFRSISTTIRRAVLPNGEISDNASSSLKRIRVSAPPPRRAVLPNAQLSDNASSALKRSRVPSAQTRDKIQKSLDAILRARGDD